MSSINMVILMGNLTRDPDLSYTQSGKPVCKLGLAVSNKYKDSKGTEIDKPCFIDVTLWNKQAENTAEYMKKGYSITIIGRLELDQWEDKEGGKHKKHNIVASKVIFGQPPKSKTPGSAAETTQPAPGTIPESAEQDEKPEENNDIPF